MCRADGDSAPEFFTDATPTARKEHKCGECGRTIHPGEIYERFSGKWDGWMGAFKTCAHCVAARWWLHIACGGWLFGEVRDELVEHWWESDSLRSITLGRLIAGMRRKWNDGKAEIPDPDLVAASIPKIARTF